MTVITWYFEQGAWWPSERGRSSPASSCWQMVVSLTRGYSVDQTPSWNKEELKKRSESSWKISILQCIQKTVGNITLMWSISYIYSALLNCLMSRLLILCIIVCNRCGTNWWSLLSGSVHTQILGIWSVFPLERMQTWFVQHILQESYDLLEFLYVKKLRK